MKALKCLRQVLDADEQGWRLYHREEIRTVLAAALAHDDVTIRATATELVHRLGERGAIQYRDLLEMRTQN